MSTLSLPEFASGLPAAEVDASLRAALNVCDRARECAVLWFAEVQRRTLYRDFGHASLQLYATQALGFSDNRYWQFKRLADDLDRLPALRRAVAAGDVGWTKAQQVARVATPQTQETWVAKARSTGRRELAAAVRAARKRRPAAVTGACLDLGLAPAQVAADLPATITLRGDALQLARFEALLEKARKLGVAPAGADRLDIVLAGLEALVEGRQASKGPSVQVVVQQCPECGGAAVATSRGEMRLAPAQVAAVACDARVAEPGKPSRATIPPKVRDAVLARDRHRCATPGCGSRSFLEVHHIVPRSEGGSHRLENLVTLCHRCHAFTHEQTGPPAAAAARPVRP